MGVNIRGDVSDGGGIHGVFLYHLLDLADRGEDRGVVSVAVLGADLLEREICERADKVHGYLTGRGRVFAAVLAAQILLGQLEVARALADDELRRGDKRSDAHDVLYSALDGGRVYRAVEYLPVGRKALYDALYLAHVRGYGLGNVRDGVVL